MKIESFTDLVDLSYRLHTLNYMKNEDTLICTNYKSLDENIRLVNILYKQLNEMQRICLMNIHEDISVRPYSITLLDSRPGTGKSHLMATFGMSCKLNILFVVYKQELVDYMNQMPYWDCYTAAKFKIKLFQLNSYKNFFSKFDISHPTINDVIARIFVLTKMMNKSFIDEYDVFIVDEYTVLNPEMVLALCFMAIVHHKHLVFCGDKCQQNAIDKSSQSDGTSNYYFISTIATRIMSLVRSVRCTDDTYNSKLDKFRSLIETSGNGSTPMNYIYGYTLYELFRDKFYAKNVFENGCYFAIHHKMLTTYTKHLKEYLRQSNVNFGVARIKNDSQDHEIPEYDEKFFYDLLLIPGMLYIFNKKKDPFIAYGQYKLNSYSDDTVILQDPVIHSKTYAVKRVRLSSDNILDTLYDRLCLKFRGPFYQFPLSPLYTSTYHNAQGLTLQCNIDLNLSKATCESVYVGLSRVKTDQQLNRLEYDDRYLRSFEYTRLQNDEYLYLINDPNCIGDFKLVKNFEKVMVRAAVGTNYKTRKIGISSDTSNRRKPMIVQAAEFIRNDVNGCVESYRTFVLPKKNNNLKSNLGYMLS